MTHSTTARLRFQVHRLTHQPEDRPELGRDGILDSATGATARREEGARWKPITSTPLLTFWACFGQLLSPDKAGRAALKRIGAWKAEEGVVVDTADTSPSCKAPARLPEAALRRLMRQTGRARHPGAPSEWRWCGRRVQLVDGTTVSMPDTPAHQEAYPQNPAQKPGLGFPIARRVVVFCLATGAVWPSPAESQANGTSLPRSHLLLSRRPPPSSGREGVPPQAPGGVLEDVQE